MEHDYNGDESEFSDEEHRLLHLENDKIYFHKVCRINYTTYDMRRDQDSINPRTHADIMVLAHEDDGHEESNKHPYWYARVIGVFHVNARYKGNTTLMHFLWVRWFGRDTAREGLGGFGTRRLHRVGFVDGKDPNTFGFLDPAVVLRAVHLIPAFAHGHDNNRLGPTIAHQPHEEDINWSYYYVNMCV